MVILGDDVADADPAARLEHASDLGQHSGLVDGEVDDAVRDDDVDGVRWQRDLSMTPLRKIAFRMPALGVLSREHLVGHVEPVGDPGLADPLGGEDDDAVGASRGRARSHPRGARRRRPGCRSFSDASTAARQLAPLLGRVERFSDGRGVRLVVGTAVAAAGQMLGSLRCTARADSA